MEDCFTDERMQQDNIAVRSSTVDSRVSASDGKGRWPSRNAIVAGFSVCRSS